MQKTRFVGGIAVLGAAASLLVGLGAGPASAATGGGCSSTVSVGNGWKIKSCVSSSGGTVKSTATVTKGTQGSGCRVYVDLILNGGVISEGDSPCSDSSFDAPSQQGSGKWFTGTWVEEGGWTSQEVISPTLSQ